MGEMTLSEYQPAIREALSCFAALRRLRFSSDDIYFMVPVPGKEKEVPFRVALRTQGKQWIYDAGFIQGTSAAFAELAVAAMKRWNEGRQPEMGDLYQNSHIVKQGIGLLLSLTTAGIKLRRS